MPDIPKNSRTYFCLLAQTWGAWGAWTQCHCQSLLETRTRQCQIHNCTGSNNETRLCNSTANCTAVGHVYQNQTQSPPSSSATNLHSSPKTHTTARHAFTVSPGATANSSHSSTKLTSTVKTRTSSSSQALAVATGGFSPTQPRTTVLHVPISTASPLSTTVDSGTSNSSLQSNTLQHHKHTTAASSKTSSLAAVSSTITAKVSNSATNLTASTTVATSSKAKPLTITVDSVNSISSTQANTIPNHKHTSTASTTSHRVTTLSQITSNVSDKVTNVTTSTTAATTSTAKPLSTTIDSGASSSSTQVKTMQNHKQTLATSTTSYLATMLSNITVKVSNSAANRTTTSTTAATSSLPGTTGPSKSIRCAVCAGPPEACELAYYEGTCLSPNHYCINHVTNLVSGDRLVERKCGTFTECHNGWYLGTSDDDKCRQMSSSSHLTFRFECTFCCTTDGCNVDLRPRHDTLYTTG